MSIAKDSLPTVLMSNSLEHLLLRLKENVRARPQEPFYRTQIIVSDAHVKTALEIELASGHGIVFGLKIDSLTSFAKGAFGISYLDMYIAALNLGSNPDSALLIANELALEVWYGCLPDREKVSKCSQVKEKLKLLKTSATERPHEIHIFAVSALCPSLNDLLFSICPETKVIYYVLSPCMHFWSDICSDQEAKRLTRKLHTKHAKAIQGYLYDRSKLLANNGTRARGFIGYLEERLDNFEEQYIVKEWVARDPAYSQYLREEAIYALESSAPTLLDIIKNDLLLMGRGEVPKLELENDISIQVHKASTLTREVEILYLYIQQAMTQISGRIVVFAPDIEVYKPYVESLFTHSFQIIGSSTYQILPLFLQILSYPHKQLQPRKTFELFQNRAFRKKCGIESDDLLILAACLQKFDGSPDVFAQQVILSWISSHATYLELTSTDAEALGKCLFTLHRLYSAIQNLTAKKTRPVSEWIKLFIEVLEGFFEPSSDERDEFYTIKKALLRACQNNEVDHEKALKIFEVSLEELEEERSSTVLAPIVFATLGEIRTLEKDVVCFLGMTEGSFPRSSGKWLRKLGFLHTAKPPYTVSAIDRHLIVEAILTTKSMLYISYQSYAFKERCSLEPSGIVIDILQTLDQSCTIEGNLPSQVLIKDHPLESCSEKVSEKVPITAPYELTSTLVTHPEVIHIHELSQVAKYPLRAYLQHGLGFYLREYKAKVQSSEFEVLDPRHSGMLKKQVFALSQQEAKQLAEHEYRSLPLSLKNAAQTLLEEDVAALNRNARALGLQADEPIQIELSLTCKTIYETSPGRWKVPALTFDIDGKTVQLAGTLTNLYREGMVVFEKKSQEALFRVWPELLLLNALRGQVPIKPQVLFIKDAKSASIELESPMTLLKDYVAYAIDCRKTPSCLYPDWIADLQKQEAPPTKLTESSEYSARDPYLDFYLLRTSKQDLQIQWSLWRKQAQTLFVGVP